MTETSLKRYKYVGKERDEETGLYYYGARYYAAWLCRFVSVDSIQFDYPELTPYQYASNRPVAMIDLDGLEGVKPKSLSTEEIMLQGAQMANKVSSTRDNTNPLRPLLPTSTVEPQKPVYKPSPVPSIGPYNPTGLSEGYLKAKSNEYKTQAKIAQAHEDMRERDPVTYDLATSPGVQIGMAVAVPGYASVQGALQLHSGLQTGNNLDISFGALGLVGGAFVRMPQSNFVLTSKSVSQGWKVGDPITNLTSKGNIPAWSTVRQRFWKNEALFKGSTYEESEVLRMQKGLAPQVFNVKTGLLESMELHHHTIPQRYGGLFDFIKVTREQHRLIDPFRK